MGSFQDVTLEMGIANGEGLASYTMLPFDFNNDLLSHSSLN